MWVLILSSRAAKPKNMREGTTGIELQQIETLARKSSTGCILRNNDVHSFHLYSSFLLHQNRSFIFT
jgi:hypothetical protein